MLRKMLANAGRMALLLLVAILAFGYLASGLDEGNAAASARSGNRSVESANDPASAGSTIQASPGDVREPLLSINTCFEERWKKADLAVAPKADWLTVCRRISLALVGSGMSLQEIRELELIAEPDRVNVYLERLLNDPRYHDYWAERFTRVYVGNEDGPFIVFRRRRFRSWLSEAFAANRPYDQIVRNLVTANGLSTDKPEVNFLTVTVNSNEEGQPNPIRLAARTTRAFLGLRIDCMQCHDDFLGNVSLGDVSLHDVSPHDVSQGGEELREGTQKDFHALAAFYSSARQDGLQGIRTEEHPYEYQFLNDDKTITVEPAVPYAAHLLPESGTPRERLAQWLTHPENKQAARATVSRVWALLYGNAMTAAVDNIPLNSELHPVVDLLAEDFVKHNFNIRRLIRLIVMAKPYQLDSAADFEITERHEKDWAAFPLVRLRPEQVAGSVIQAARVKTVDRESSLILQLMKFGGVNDFVTRYGDTGEDELDQENVTITQRLIMLNGELVGEYSDENPLFNSSSHILMFAQNDEDAIAATYLCVLNRLPDNEEKQIYKQRLTDATDRNAVVVDLFWVLLNSSELAWNH